MNNVTAAYQMVFIIAICVLLPITMASLRDSRYLVWISI